MVPGLEMTAKDARTRLLRVVRDELDEPSGLERLAPLVADSGRDRELVAELLKAKEEHARAAWFVEAEPLWLRKLTFRLIRPLLVVGALAAVFFATQDVIDPTLGISLFLFGAAALYVTVQLFTHVWARRDEKQLEAARQRYRRRLEELAARAESSFD